MLCLGFPFFTLPRQSQIKVWEAPGLWLLRPSLLHGNFHFLKRLLGLSGQCCNAVCVRKEQGNPPPVRTQIHCHMLHRGTFSCTLKYDEFMKRISSEINKFNECNEACLQILSLFSSTSLRNSLLNVFASVFWGGCSPADDTNISCACS